MKISLGLLLAIGILFLVVNSAAPQTAEKSQAAAGTSSRYQLIVQNDGKALFRLDSFTGNLWTFDTEVMEFVTEEYLKQNFPDMTDDGRAEILSQNRSFRNGKAYCVPSHWKLLPERAE